MDYWHSTQFLSRNLRGIDDVSMIPPSIVYIVNAIDALSDKLPRLVRSCRLQYWGMILAHRGFEKNQVHDGEGCAHLAALSLYTAILAAGGQEIPPDWDQQVATVFPCEVIHRTCVSALELALPFFVSSTLGFDLHTHHPWEVLALLVTSEQETLLAAGVVNSLYRTRAVIEFSPYVVAIAALTAARLLRNDHSDVSKWLRGLPVSFAAVQRILVDYLSPFVEFSEFPSLTPPALEEVHSPSTRKSVSRQSSRTKTVSSQRPARSEKKCSLAWALLPPDENLPIGNSDSNLNRPISLSELSILRELSKISDIRGIVLLQSVSLYPSELGLHKKSLGQFAVHGSFDSNGTQFDSILKLLSTESDLFSVFEQILAATHFLNENRICHYSIEPRNVMITTDNKVKLASLYGATVLPSLPSGLPSMEYRAPELLLGSSVRDDPLGVDLWSLGCLLAEIGRIFVTRNRYEEPLFRVEESLLKKNPIKDPLVYDNCRYLIQMTRILGIDPTSKVWPGVENRTHYNSLLALVAVQKKSSVFGPEQPTLATYLKETTPSIVSTILKALLRWCPDRRASPQTCLQHLGKFKSKLI